MPRLTVKATALLLALLVAIPVFAQTLGIDANSRAALQGIYATRPDLQASFGPDGQAVPAMRARGLSTLEEWAMRYGANEYPALLGAFAKVPLASVPRALRERPALFVPVKITKDEFASARFTATSLLILDDASRKVLVSKNAGAQWPIASISKLMTALVTIDHGIKMNATSTIIREDEVGGARLRVDNGTPLVMHDIFDSMLIGSANNAANAVARHTGLSKADFVAAMNARADAMGMPLTTFVDPTGINPANVSTAEGVAALALEAFDVYDIRRATTTSRFTLMAANQTHTITNTDGLLNDPKNGLYVMGGKTGYLNESRWNFVVRLRDATHRPLLVVVLGSSDQKQSFNDAAMAAKWVWANYRWQKATK